MMRASNGNGHEIRVVSLATFLSVVFSIGSVAGALGTWAVAQRFERAATKEAISIEFQRVADQMVSRVNERFDIELRSAKEIHDGLSNRIGEVRHGLGRLEERVDRMRAR